MTASVLVVVEEHDARHDVLRGLLRRDRDRVRSEGLPPRVLQGLLLTRTVLFVCVENAARSLMAEAFFNADPPEGWRAISAGTEPAPRPNGRTGPMLREVG